MPDLYLKSCESMDELPDDSMDLIVTSPPYWRGTEDNYLREAAPRARDGQPVTSYPAYLRWLADCFAECYRVLKPGRLCAVVVAPTLVKGERFPLPFHLVGRMERLGFRFFEDIVWHRWRGWDKRAGNSIQHPYPGYYTPNRVVEYVLVFAKPGGERLFVGRSATERAASRLVIDDLFTREIAHNLWHIAPIPPRSFPHPCPFPEELAYRLITLYSYKGEKVLDPFLGSGTTAKVAARTGRDYYGYEVQPAFLALAQQRLQESTLHREGWVARFKPSAREGVSSTRHKRSSTYQEKP